MGKHDGNSQDSLPKPPALENVVPIKLEPARETLEPGTKRKVKLGVIVGHEKNAGGALLKLSRMNEYSYNGEVARLMKLMASELNDIEVVIILRDGIGIDGAYKKANEALCDCVIELHFNAFDGKAIGTQTLSTSDARDVEFATLVQKAMCRVFERTSISRGVTKLARSARGGGNVHGFPAGANCLVEPFFGDVASEEKMALGKQRDYAACLLEAVRTWARMKEII
jgi:N-acetylmuramoyl-L-alanine amidase